MDTPSPAPLTRRRWFWAALIVASALAATCSFHLFPKAFPLVTLDIHMDRGHAIDAARALASAQKWGPDGTLRDAASFGSDGAAQSFVELEGGGKPAWTALLHDELFSPYAWQVRLFKEGETRQVIVRFKPGGQPYGFVETLREDAKGPALPADRARAIGETAARAAPWNLPLERFTLVESSQETRPGGRVDHTFVYERPDRGFGEGRLRLQLVVGGDRLIALSHFLKIPEAFSRRYEQMRSANNAIAAAASVAMVLLYLVAGAGGGLFLLMRERALLWRQPLYWAAFIAGLQFLAGLNAWPLEWLGYDTALSAGGFITERLVALVANTAVMGLVFFLSFMMAEGLTRRAFPQHPQLWRVWSRDAAPSPAILGRTLGGYLMAAFSLLYVLVFYYYTTRRLGWWSPSEALTDPDSLAHVLPWLTPFARAAQAGFWEETLFRAIPLAGAALLGSRYGGRKWWILGAFILQALVFASAHANYPGQPAYSRVIELIVPSFIFGGLYLAFGLVPSILLHFTYDIVLMSLPLFAASASGIWIHRTLVIVASLVPLGVVLWRRVQAGAARELPADLRNGAWQPPPRAAASEATETVAAPVAISARLPRWVAIAGVLGLAAWLATSPFDRFGPPLNVTRTDAIQLARAELERRGVKLAPTFRASARVGDRPDAAERFVWQTAGRETYASLVGHYLPPARWLVRFASFEGDVAERAEEWIVGIDGAGHVQRVEHRVPEARAGASLTEPEARERVRAAVRSLWARDPATLTEVSATSNKRPHRLDWAFVFKDPAVKSLAPGEARLEVELSGDEVTDAARFVFVPENWERADRALQTSFRIGSIVKNIATTLLILTGAGLGIAAWSRRKFSVRVAGAVAGLMFLAAAGSALNSWPATVTRFSTAQPLGLQRTLALTLPLIGAALLAGIIGLIAGLVARWLRPSPLPERSSSLLGAGTAGLLLGALSLGALPRAGMGPDWPQLAPAGTWLPWLAPGLGLIGQLCVQSTSLLLAALLLERLTSGWQRRRALGAGLLVVAAAVFSLPWGGPSLGAWLASAAANTVVFTLVYLLVLRRDLTVLPLTLGTAAAFAALGSAVTQAYAGAVPAAVFAAVVALALGWFGHRAARRLGAANVASA